VYGASTASPVASSSCTGVIPSRFPLISVSVAEESLKYLRTVPIAHNELHSSGFRADYRPSGSYPKTGVMSGLATMRPEPERPGRFVLETCIGLSAPVESGTSPFNRRA